MANEQSAEDQLHRLLAITWDPGQADLAGTIPWGDVTQLARMHGVAPLVYTAVQEAELRVPGETQATLEHSYYLTARANILAAEELAPLLAAFSAAGVATLLVKGLALAETEYGSLALRPMGDFDLAVVPEQVPLCREILVGLGYGRTQVEMSPGTQVAYRNEEVFTPPDGSGRRVELHWHLLDAPYYLRRVPMAWFWEKSQVHELSGQPVHTLTAEANILYLSAHLALHHRFQGLRWFVDLAVLIQRHQVTLDWETVAQAAQRFELLLVVRETLDRLAEYWPSLPLDGARERLHTLQPTGFETRLFRLLTAEPRTPLLDFYADLVSLPDLAARMRFLLLNTFPQRAYMAQRYGVERSWQLPYWYLYRLGDGAVKMARTVQQVLRLRSG